MTTFDPSGPASFDGIYGLPFTPDEARVVVIPVPWEPTTSYRKGTAGGPAAILEASRQVDLFDLENGKPYEAGIAMLPTDERVVRWNQQARDLAQPIIDAGGAATADLAEALAEVNTHSRNLSALVEEIANVWLSKGKLVAVLGGDHASPLGLIRACAKKHPGLGILHIDAHADLRDAYEGFVESHASIMFNVHETVPEVAKIVQVGIRDFSAEEHALATSSPRIESYYDADLARRSFEGEPYVRLVAEIVGHLPQDVYISFDIDGLDPSLCPNTGTPVPGGLSFQQANALIRGVRRTGRKIVGFDLNEVGGEEWDANVGARMLYKMIGHALASHH